MTPLDNYVGVRMNRSISAAIGVALLTSIAMATTAEARGRHVVEVRMEDRCDPKTFNAPAPGGLGAGACVPLKRRGGTVTFQELVATLNPVDFGHEKWRNSREDFTIEKGDAIRVKNTGGEVHSFTLVDEFGGGCVAEINEPLGLTPAPGLDCGSPATGPGDVDEIQAPGQVRTIPPPDLAVGEHKFICIIHPWMRSVVEVERD